MKKYIFTILFLLFITPCYAASKYWVGGGSTTDWAATTPTNWSDTDGGGNNATVPAAGDDVFLKSAADCAIGTNTNALKSFDASAYTGNLSGGSNIVVRGANSTTIVIKFPSSPASFTWTGLLSITTGGTGRIYNLYTNGQQLSAVTVNPASGGTFNLEDNLNMGTSTLTITNGSFISNGYTITCGVFSSNNTNTRTINISGSTVNIGSTGTVWNMASNTNLTFTTNTSTTIAFTNTSASTKAVNIANTAGSGIVFNDITVPATSGAITFNADGSSCRNFTITAPATVKWTVAKTFTITGAFTANGSLGNLITLSSSSSGSTTILTLNGTVTANYISIRDITNNGSSAPSNGGANSTNTSNNPGWVFIHTISDIGGNNNDTTAWVEGVSPISYDRHDVRATATSGNLVWVTAPVLQSFDLTNYQGILSGANSITLQPNNNDTVKCLFAGTITWTGSLLLDPQGTSIINLTSNGKLSSINGISQDLTSTGTISQQDNLDLSSSGSTSLAFGYGTWNTNGYSIAIGTGVSFNYSTTRTFNCTDSTITCSGTGTVWIANSTGFTFTSTGSTIIINNASTSAKTFAGGGLTYGTVTFSGDKITVTGNNTFNTMNVNNAGLANGLILTAGSTQTVTNFTTNGYASNLAILKSSAASASTLTTASPQISVDYMNLTYIQPTQANTWYAGTHSTDGGNNGNWIFTAPPSPGAVIKTINGIALGSVKTVNGIVIGSVKTINGLAAQ